ncbi:MAG: hypothetical protein GC193_00765 [Cryomorphaceae bacterium]|nr:hypothetical protein [Cryomorphaceae bacterium]
MKQVFTLILFVLTLGVQAQLSLTVDVSCSATPNPSSVRMTGAFWGWDPNGGPVAADNGDGTWTVVLDPAPAANMEYKWNVEGVIENLIDDMVGGASCAPITDFVNYANRLWSVGDPDTFDTYDQCAGCVPATGVTLTVDVSCTAPTATAVRMTGPFWGWDPNAGPVATDNGDGTWSVTLDPMPTVDMEYLWLADGVQENLIDDMAGGASCAPITDFASYANRLWTVGSGNVSNTYDQCGGCVAPPLTVTVDVSCSGTPAPASVRMTGPFWGWDPNAGPIAADNGDGTWTVTLDPAPAANMEYLWVVDGVQENLISAMQNGGTCAPITDFSNYANRLWNVGDANPSGTYGQCDACGAGGCTDATAANYDAAATFDDGSCLYNVTFQVDMNNYPNAIGFVNVSGTWNGWCADCNQMEDLDLDGVWVGTFPLAPGDYLFKYQIDSWTDQENLSPGSCTLTQGGNTNRTLDVAAAAQTLDVVCFASCFACIGGGVPGCTDATAANYDPAATANDGSCLYDVTFSIDLQQYAGAYTDVNINGTFNGWCGACAIMEDLDGDLTYDITIQLQEGYYEYKFTLDGFTAQENFTAISECVTENFGFFNRYVNISSNTALAPVCWESCEDCVVGVVFGCTDPGATNYNPAANTLDGTCLYSIALSVDMNSYAGTFTTVYVAGTFNGWSADANPLQDADLDGIWQTTLLLNSGSQEYKFQVDMWADDETFVGGEPCTFTSLGFTNREIIVNSSVVLPVVCWESCSACATEFYTVTFRVDMSNETVSPTGVYLVGSFQGWDATSTPTSYMGYGIYEYAILFGSGDSFEYKYLNGNDFVGEETVPGACGLDDGFGAFNRTHTVGNSDETLLVCFSSCEACAGCTDPLSLEYNPFAGSDDGSCATSLVYGCTYSDADNYNAAANVDDGSCMFTTGSDCPEDLNGDGIINAGDLLQFLGAFGTACL